MAAPFGKLLRQYRRASGMTQAGLAELSGVSAQAISMLERGTRMHPRQETVALLAGALELPDDATATLRSAASRSPSISNAAADGAAAASIGVPPRWLPPAVGDFTGRDPELTELCYVLSSAPDMSAMVVAAIDGMGGIGKTTLAVHAAHLVADQFPDGQLYINLHGFGPGERMSPTDALDQILASLGMSTAEQTTVEEASGRYRSALAGQRVLVVLDNASDAEQVIPLLPGTAGCAAIVTSRQSLAGLPGARHLYLDVLSTDESLALLSSIIGENRVRAELDDATELVGRCGQLPLALRVAGARLLARPGWPVSVLAEQLSDERRRLDELELRDAGVRASFTASLRGLVESNDALDNEAAAAFPLLGILDSPQIGLEVAARVIDKPAGRARRVLERLVDSHLIETHTPERYRLHDLLRSYAREHAVANLSEQQLSAVLTRVLVLYNTTAWRAYAAFSPQHVRLRYADRRWVAEELDGVDPEEALRWLIDERQNMLVTMQQAAEHPGVARSLISQLAIASLNHINTGGYWPLLTAISRVSLDAALSTNDRIAQGFAHHDLGAAHNQVGRTDEAVLELDRAIELFREEGDKPAEAMALCNVAYTFERVGRVDDGIRAAERGLQLCIHSELRHLEATTCLALGLLHGLSGNRAQELAYHERSLSIYAEIGYDRGRARALYNLGVAWRSVGREDEAVPALESAIELTDQLGLMNSAADARSELATIYCAAGSPDLALALCAEAVSISVQVGSELSEARARHAMGNALKASRRSSEARSEWYAAQLIYERLGAPTADEVRQLVSDFR